MPNLITGLPTFHSLHLCYTVLLMKDSQCDRVGFISCCDWEGVS